MNDQAKTSRQALREDPILSPYDGQEVGRMPVANAAAVEAAIERGRGFEIMRRLPRFVRADILGPVFS